MATLMSRLNQILPPVTTTEENTNATDGKIVDGVYLKGDLPIADCQ